MVWTRRRHMLIMVNIGTVLVLLFITCTVRGLVARRSTAGSQLQPDMVTQHKFEDIYDNRLWSTDNGGSGTGSSLAVTQYAMSCVRTVVNKFQIGSMADVPCGGMHWQPSLLRDLKDDVRDFSFLGTDIVRSVIQANEARFSNESWMHFEVLDFTRALVPAGIELILCRDALQHLPLGKAIDALEMFSKSTARFLLLGSYLGTDGKNALIEVGDYYSIDVTTDPFLLTGYQHLYHEHTRDIQNEVDKHLLLFSVTYLKNVDFTAMRKRASLFGK